MTSPGRMPTDATDPTRAGTEVTDLSPAEFERAARAALVWVIRYLETNSSLPVVPDLRPGDVARLLPLTAPDTPESLDDILADFERIIVPGTTHWNHPGFMAYFAITGSAPGIIAELLSAALNNNAMLWKTGPAETELEQRTLDWLRSAMGLGDGWTGVINDTASISTMLALASAREAIDRDVRERGLAGRSDLPRLRVYTSEHSHSSVDKAAITLGVGQENVVHVPVDDRYRMRSAELARAIAADRAAGFLPLAVVATVGTTSTSSVDPVDQILEITRREDVWLHVDASYAGSAALLPECRHHFTGTDAADSLVVNPHKWLFVPVDLSALYTRRPDVLKRAFSLVPEYLVTREQDEAMNLMDYGIQLGRRFRSLKLWFVMRAFGLEGLRERLRRHIALAAHFAGLVALEPGWTVTAPHPFSLVCFRATPPGLSDRATDDLNERILTRVNGTGRVFLSHTRLDGRYTIRLAIGNLRTTRVHVDEAWSLLRAAAAEG
ncbi:MAG: pyridoxal phosphate-dependent decarboxylase family protein [Gemmatimonadota bacterium]